MSWQDDEREEIKRQAALQAKEDGGPAFPFAINPQEMSIQYKGATLRDYFAQAAPSDEISDISYRNLSQIAKEHLAGMKAPTKPVTASGADVIPFDIELARFNCKVNAAIRYMMADAMLDERAKHDKESLDLDAVRYRWLREQNWNESSLSVVCNPIEAVKLGHDCPSGQRLDDIIDAAMSAKCDHQFTDTPFCEKCGSTGSEGLDSSALSNNDDKLIAEMVDVCVTDNIRSNCEDLYRAGYRIFPTYLLEALKLCNRQLCKLLDRMPDMGDEQYEAVKDAGKAIARAKGEA